MKKTLAVILCIVTLFSMLNIFAFAQNEEITEEPTVIEGADFEMYDEEDSLYNRLMDKPFYVVGTPSYFINLFTALGLALASVPISLLGLIFGIAIPPVLVAGFAAVPMALANLGLAFVGLRGDMTLNTLDEILYHFGIHLL